MLLAARSGAPLRRQRDHHVGNVAVGGRLGGRLRVADRLERNGARRVDVLVDEVRRDLQGRGVVIEVALDVVVGQPGRGVDVEPEQIADRVSVLAAIETTQRDASRLALHRRGVDLVLEPRHELGGRVTIRPLCASRRHQTTAQLADHFLGNFGALARRVQIQCRQRQATRFEPVVVAGHAVLIDERALRGLRCGSRRVHGPWTRLGAGGVGAGGADWASPSNHRSLSTQRYTRATTVAVTVLMPRPYGPAKNHPKSSGIRGRARSTDNTAPVELTGANTAKSGKSGRAGGRVACRYSAPAEIIRRFVGAAGRSGAAPPPMRFLATTMLSK